MLRKTYDIVFIILFLMIISLPFIFANRFQEEISLDENRKLASKPQLIVEGSLNSDFIAEYEKWFKDNMGFRKNLINTNAWIQYNLFNRLLNSSYYYIGEDGDLNYATYAIIRDYQHLNLRSDDSLKTIADSYQIVNDWIEGKGIQFYYVQCYDKHSVYPEQFMKTLNQRGDISKTDQMIGYLEDNTSVNVISLKETLLENKEEGYEVYSNWGDPTHWTPRGAYIGYQYIMNEINKENDNQFYILEEEDYNIEIIDQGKTFSGSIHVVDEFEKFTIKEPKAISIDKTVMGEYGEDNRHFAMINGDVENDTKVLLLCDSYVGGFIAEDFAESFAQTWLIWADNTLKLESIIEIYEPDIIIYECAERVDRSSSICKLANLIR